jgi:hypothetical protein
MSSVSQIAKNGGHSGQNHLSAHAQLKSISQSESDSHYMKSEQKEGRMSAVK